MRTAVLALLTIVALPSIVAGFLFSLFSAGFVAGTSLMQDFGAWVRGES